MDINIELLIDQVLSYTAQAGEVLQSDFLVNKKEFSTYTSLFLPSGPDFYTGPLKAAGYLLLNQRLKKVILIAKQEQFPDQITLYKNKGLTVLGQKIKTNIRYKGLISVETMSEEIQKQLVFLRIITAIDQVVILEVGTNVGSKELISVIKEIKGKKNDYGCIFFDTCSSSVPMKEGKKSDEALVKQVFSQKVSKENPTWLGNSFVLLGKQYHQKPEIVGYFNSGDFGGDPSNATGYVCIVS